MVPQDEVYGAYPASGLMSIFESRGNMPKSRLEILANDMVSGLHWGPADHPSYDRYVLYSSLLSILSVPLRLTRAFALFVDSG